MALTYKPKDTATIREFKIDNDESNKIIMHQYSAHTVLYLKLFAEEGRKRKIGTITQSTKTLKIIRNREKHLFRKLHAYGFNEYVLRTGKSFDTLWLKDDLDEWKIPVEFILKNGKDEHGQKFLHFAKQGFELQIFVTLEDIAQFKVLRKFKTRF